MLDRLEHLMVHHYLVSNYKLILLEAWTYWITQVTPQTILELLCASGLQIPDHINTGSPCNSEHFTLRLTTSADKECTEINLRKID
jgi:hypothetical protein